MWGFLIGGSLAPFFVWVEYTLGDSQTEGAKIACILLNFCTHPVVTIGLIWGYYGVMRGRSIFDLPMSMGGRQPDERDLSLLRQENAKVTSRIQI